MRRRGEECLAASSICVRAANIAEYENICALIAQLDDYHRSIRPDIFRRPPGTARELSYIDALIQGPDSTILVADGPTGPPLGLVILIAKSIPASIVRGARRFVEIDNLIVHPAARRRGIAQALLSASKNWAASRQIQHLEVPAWSFNDAAVTFYKTFGFQPAVERLTMMFDDGALRSDASLAGKQ